MKSDRKSEYISYIVCSLLSFLLSRAGFLYPAGGLLILEGIFLYVVNFRRTASLVDLRGLFSLSWIGGEGLACFQLSRLQSDWENVTWLCFFLAYFCFMLGYDVIQKKCIRTSEPVQMERSERQAEHILICIIFLGVGSVICFLAEALIVGFIPLFSPEPHAYSYFHVSGVHYFTISCILIPALTVLYSKLAERKVLWKLFILACGNIIAVAIPILCVSRFQLLFAVGFAAVVYLMLYRRVTWKMILGALVIMIPVYVLLTVARRHDVSYLNGIFEMKYENTPIFITQPYIYVVNNYENFNCMVLQLSEFTKGIRMLFPVFALTGLKFVFPELVSSPLFVTKPELTTLTMFYDAYYDFGIIGIILFAFVLGAVAAWLTGWIQRNHNPVAYLFYGQIAIYLGLSFFTTWFSNPTTWFWFILTLGMYLFTGYEKEKRKKSGAVE